MPLADDLTDEEHARLLAQALAERVDADEVFTGLLADHYTVGDLAELFATSQQTINRWFREGPPGDRPLPWQSDGWIVDGTRKKRLPAESLNLSVLTEAQRERALLIRQRAVA